jgi:O-methyltransferase
VSLGGVVIIDDYGYTSGCRKAVDDFCSDKHIFPQRIDWESRTWVKTEAGTDRAG